jgi:hypothetical protein
MAANTESSSSNMVSTSTAAVGTAREGLASLLAELDTTSDWAALAGVLRRVLQGERGGQLLAGLDETDTAIVTVLLGRLDAQPETQGGP